MKFPVISKTSSCQRKRLLLLVLLVTIWVSPASSLRCPERCHCRNDVKGRKLVECDAGSIGSGIPVFDMDRDTQVWNDMNNVLGYLITHSLFEYRRKDHIMVQKISTF